jgi:hypothetical protein
MPAFQLDMSLSAQALSLWRKPSWERQLFLDSEAAGQTDSLNARGEDVRLTDMGSEPLRNENPPTVELAPIGGQLFAHGISQRD